METRSITSRSEVEDSRISCDKLRNSVSVDFFIMLMSIGLMLGPDVRSGARSMLRRMSVGVKV